MSAVMAKSLATASHNVTPLVTKKMATQVTARQGELLAPVAQEAGMALEKQIERLLLHFAGMAEARGKTMIAAGLRLLSQIVTALMGVPKQVPT